MSSKENEAETDEYLVLLQGTEMSQNLSCT